MYSESWSLMVHLMVFVGAALLIALVGNLLAGYAKKLARETGLGQAITGALFLGAVTSLSGIVTSVAAAWDGHAELAASNAVGGIAAQTVFLAIADILYRKANLEHSAASDENMLQGALLITLLSLALIATALPPFQILGVHPVSVLLVLFYALGQRLVFRAQGQDMWRPRFTEYTQVVDTERGEDRIDVPKDHGREHAGRFYLLYLWGKFLGAAFVISVLGYLLAMTGVTIAARTGLGETVVGGLFTAVSTSFPELVTAIAAVRMGALTLAVSDIIGGNAFDLLFLAVADLAYSGGSLYHDMGDRPRFLILLTILLTAVLLMGLIRREKHGIANIGFESVLLLLVYMSGFVLVVTVV